MTYYEISKPLKRMTKVELVDRLTRVINLLTSPRIEEGAYANGWYDSRRNIMDIVGFNELYDIQPLEEEDYVQNFVND